MNVKIIKSLTISILIFLSGCDNSKKPKVFSKKDLKNMTPADILQGLSDGNQRFYTDSKLKRASLQSKGELAAQVGQSPKAVILCCMDSRSIPEIVFDQSIADIFTLRVAGNVVNKDILASMEFATKFVGSKLIVVMGHTACGAIKGACNNVKSGNLTHLLKTIQPAVEAVDKNRNCKDDQIINKIAEKNVENMIHQIINESNTIKEQLDKKEIAIVGAMHNLESGKVEFKIFKGL